MHEIRDVTLGDLLDWSSVRVVVDQREEIVFRIKNVHFVVKVWSKIN